jgi:N-acetylglucosaminyl-diphospho-decaprenol L-rhamnosyltransferase
MHLLIEESMVSAYDGAMLSVSIVSHGQGHLLEALLHDVKALQLASPLEILVTHNLPDALNLEPLLAPWEHQVISNPAPKGFAANHNAAFARARGEWFCVLNPDIRLPSNPFDTLLGHAKSYPKHILAPAVFNPQGTLEDSARRFPTLLGLGAKALGFSDGSVSFHGADAPFAVDWVAGMCMFFHRDTYAALGGFDEGFFLYYEDVDMCARHRKAGGEVMLCPNAHIIHDAQRNSRSNARYMRWHLSSMARYFMKHPDIALLGRRA